MQSLGIWRTEVKAAPCELPCCLQAEGELFLERPTRVTHRYVFGLGVAGNGDL